MQIWFLFDHRFWQAGTPLNPTQQAIDAANASFWDELCGSVAARAWGITDSSMESLRRYDENYFRFYPYLEEFVGCKDLRGKRVLEVGLGYGSLSQKIADSGADFTGLDIAPGPVTMVNHRLQQSGLRGRAVQGSILNSPFPEGSFDAVVAIGCLHHTGDLAAAIAACRRLLVPGGRLTGMVYYAYSYRQLWLQPRRAVRHLLREFGGYRGTFRDGETSAYDETQDGSLAPATEFISVKALKAFCSGYTDFRAETKNIAQEAPFRPWTRDQLLASPIPGLCGLDVYWTCRKPNA